MMEHLMNSLDNLSHWREFQRYLFEKNGKIPKEIWPKADEDAPWENYPSVYGQRLLKDKEFWKQAQNLEISPISRSKLSPNQLI